MVVSGFQAQDLSSPEMIHLLSAYIFLSNKNYLQLNIVHSFFNSPLAIANIKEETPGCIKNQVQETECQIEDKDEVCRKIDGGAKCPDKDGTTATDSRELNQNDTIQKHEDNNADEVCTNGFQNDKAVIGSTETNNFKEDDKKKKKIIDSIKANSEKEEALSDETTTKELTQEKHAILDDDSSNKKDSLKECTVLPTEVQQINRNCPDEIKTGVYINPPTTQCSDIASFPTEVSITEQVTQLTNVVTQKVPPEGKLPVPVVCTKYSQEERPLKHTSQPINKDHCVPSKLDKRTRTLVDYQPNEVINMDSRLQDSLSKYEHEITTFPPEARDQFIKKNSDADEVFTKPCEISDERNVNKANVTSAESATEKSDIFVNVAQNEKSNPYKEIDKLLKKEQIEKDLVEAKTSVVDIGQFLSCEFSPEMSAKTCMIAKIDKVLAQTNQTTRPSDKMFEGVTPQADCNTVVNAGKFTWYFRRSQIITYSNKLPSFGFSVLADVSNINYNFWYIKHFHRIHKKITYSYCSRLFCRSQILRL